MMSLTLQNAATILFSYFIKFLPGIGISTNDMQQLFKPFPTINTGAGSLKTYTGSGLGLAISDSLCKVSIVCICV